MSAVGAQATSAGAGPNPGTSRGSTSGSAACTSAGAGATGRTSGLRSDRGSAVAADASTGRGAGAPASDAPASDAPAPGTPRRSTSGSGSQLVTTGATCSSTPHARASFRLDSNTGGTRLGRGASDATRGGAGATAAGGAGEVARWLGACRGTASGSKRASGTHGSSSGMSSGMTNSGIAAISSAGGTRGDGIESDATASMGSFSPRVRRPGGNELVTGGASATRPRNPAKSPLRAAGAGVGAGTVGAAGAAGAAAASACGTTTRSGPPGVARLGRIVAEPPASTAGAQSPRTAESSSGNDTSGRTGRTIWCSPVSATASAARCPPTSERARRRGRPTPVAPSVIPARSTGTASGASASRGADPAAAGSAPES